MLARPRTVAIVVIAGLCAVATTAIALPALSAPRKVSGHASLSLAQKALNLAKVADRRSKLALSRAKPGPRGLQGPAGTNGTNGRDGTNGSSSTVPGPPGQAGSTLKPQLTVGGPMTSVGAPQEIPFTQA